MQFIKIKTAIRSLIRRLGIDVVRYQENDCRPLYPVDFSEQNMAICNAVRPYTLTNPERVNALIEAVRYVVASKIDGAMVECGVWKGGSIMAIALTLKELGDEDREIYLYDTFSGMSAPSDVDCSIYGEHSRETFSKTKISDDASNYCLAALEEVQENVCGTGYPEDKFHFIKGKIENTIPGSTPGEIALLRLDTDWYESTKHELTHLFPLLKPKGVLIIDDYGHWEGQRKAMDEYIANNGLCIFLHRIDYAARIGTKA